MFSGRPQKCLPRADVAESDIALGSNPTRDGCTEPRDIQIICHGCLIPPPDLIQNIQALDSDLRSTISGIGTHSVESR